MKILSMSCGTMVSILTASAGLIAVGVGTLVIQYDPQTGRPLRYQTYAYATTPYDRPFRWYDTSIPENYPENEANIDVTGGELKWTSHLKWGYFYNVIGDWKSGKLAWAHTQE